MQIETVKKSILYAAILFGFFVSACSTSKISIRKDAIKQIKTIAVMPFKSSVADAKATRESSEAFKGALINAGFQVVEREKLKKVLKEKELAQSGLVDNKAIEAGQFLGAEAIMLGEITAHEVTSDEITVEDTTPLPAPPAGSNPYERPKRYKKEKRDTFQFQIVVRLVSSSDAQTVMTLQNEYPVRTYSASQGGLNPANIDQFRSQVLTQMGKDLEKAVKEAREP